MRLKHRHHLKFFIPLLAAGLVTACSGEKASSEKEALEKIKAEYGTEAQQSQGEQSEETKRFAEADSSEETEDAQIQKESQRQAAEELLQGTWQCERQVGTIEILEFENGKVDYTYSADLSKGTWHHSAGTYRVTDSQVITTMNNYDSHFDYELENGKLTLQLYIDSGADKGTTYTFSQTEKGASSEKGLPDAGTVPDTSSAVYGRDYTLETSAAPDGDFGYTLRETPSKRQNENYGSYATTGERNALDKAYSYLQYTAFSYTGLIEQLEFEGFTPSEAQYGADHCGADWKEQAARKAQQYLEYSSFSRSGLIEQLEFEGFTRSEAEYGVSQVY